MTGNFIEQIIETQLRTNKQMISEKKIMYHQIVKNIKNFYENGATFRIKLIKNMRKMISTNERMKKLLKMEEIRNKNILMIMYSN